MVPVRSCTSTASGSEHEVLFSRAPSEREAGTRACCVFMPWACFRGEGEATSARFSGGADVLRGVDSILKESKGNESEGDPGAWLDP